MSTVRLITEKGGVAQDGERIRHVQVVDFNLIVPGCDHITLQRLNREGDKARSVGIQ